MKSPVLFLIFNRPELTHKVFSVVRSARPPRLYIAADGPRSHVDGDLELCEKARSIIGLVDWPCEVFTRLQEKNIGLKFGVSGAISWFFEHEEYGIVIEDDVLPSLSFFSFCNEMLIRYRYDARIGHISGYTAKSYPYQDSYRFTRLPNIWGWASWRRAWDLYKVEISLEDITETDFSIYLDQADSEKSVFLNYLNNKLVTWDLQWIFCLLKNGFISISPNKSLIKNIGFSKDATHTKVLHRIHSFVNQQEISFPLRHPKSILSDPLLDRDYLHTTAGSRGPIIPIIYGVLGTLGIRKIILRLRYLYLSILEMLSTKIR
jgi:hypothetical protein